MPGKPFINTTSTSGEIYYYCSADVFKSIVEHSRLWLTHTTEMNDLEEGLVSYELLDQWKKSIPMNGQISSVLQLHEKNRRESDHKNFYCCCFSKAKDSQLLWRTYGNDFQGFCLGFDVTSFRVTPDLEHRLFTRTPTALLYMEDVEYSDSIDTISRIINPELATNKDYHFTDDELSTILSDLVMKSVTLKRPGFAGEEEVRLIFNNAIYRRTQSTKGWQTNFPTFEVSTKKFRRYKNTLSPYFELYFANKNFLKSVSYGPCNESDSQNIKDFLETYGFNNTKVFKSSIKYRR